MNSFSIALSIQGKYEEAEMISQQAFELRNNVPLELFCRGCLWQCQSRISFAPSSHVKWQLQLSIFPSPSRYTMLMLALVPITPLDVDFVSSFASCCFTVGDTSLLFLEASGSFSCSCWSLREQLPLGSRCLSTFSRFPRSCLYLPIAWTDEEDLIFPTHRWPHLSISLLICPLIKHGTLNMHLVSDYLSVGAFVSRRHLSAETIYQLKSFISGK